MKMVITGSIAYDYLMSFPGHFRDHILPDRLDSLSLSFLVDKLIRRRGGVAGDVRGMDRACRRAVACRGGGSPAAAAEGGAPVALAAAG